MLSVITTLEFLQHYFAKMGHRNASCDPHLHPSHQATNAPLPHAKRPPPGGYVQTPLPDISNDGGPVKSFLRVLLHSLLRVVLFVFFTLCIDDHGSFVI